MKKVFVDSLNIGKALDMDRHSIGQGGLSSDPMIDPHTYEIKNLGIRIIRLFLQEYFHVYPCHGTYNWEAMDRSIEAILACGAKPLMCICLRPKLLFPAINQKSVHPNSYEEWDKLIFEMVRHCNTEKKYGIEYWEIGNEPDAGEGGGSPYFFTPENFTDYYRHTANAVKKADPKAKTGGPAVADHTSPILPALVKYCAETKVPLDFVSWHMYNDDPKDFEASIVHVKQILAQYEMPCETVLDEWNVSWFASMMKNLNQPAYQPAYVIDVINKMIEQDLSISCFYQIRNMNTSKAVFSDFLSEHGTAEFMYFSNYLFNLLGVFDNQGQMRPVYFAFKLLSRMRGYKTFSQSSGNIRVLSSYDPSFKELNILIWNFDVDKCKKENVTLHVKMAEGYYDLQRYLLDAETPSNNEDARLKVVDWRQLKNVSELKCSFPLDTYGVSMLHLKSR